MAFSCYLAMTAAEFRANPVLPPEIAWMACHFSSYGTGLSNCPEALPKGAMVILNDRTPVHGHDPALIAAELKEIVELQPVSAVLLDFQRPGSEETAAIAKAVVGALPCPTAVSDLYAKGLDCPVFLPPPPLHCPLEAHLAPWAGREIWLEAALDAEAITVTANGTQFTPLSPGDLPDTGHVEETLHCRYQIAQMQDRIRFSLFRTPEMLRSLLHAAESLGVTQAVGLFQELGDQALGQ